MEFHGVLAGFTAKGFHWIYKRPKLFEFDPDQKGFFFYHWNGFVTVQRMISGHMIQAE